MRIFCVRIGEKYDVRYEEYLNKKLEDIGYKITWIRKPFDDRVALQWNKLDVMRMKINEPVSGKLPLLHLALPRLVNVTTSVVLVNNSLLLVKDEVEKVQVVPTIGRGPCVIKNVFHLPPVTLSSLYGPLSLM